jgi:glycosyltransferase involved in cell wall biosynthesis
MAKEIIMHKKNYALVTAARNESWYIEKTIQSVICQSILPCKWIIVSDGSTDGTEKIARNFETKYNFIRLLRIENNGERNSAGQANALNYGYQKILEEEPDFIGFLDADITMEKNYYENILEEFEKDESLGIGGGLLFDVYKGKIYNSRRKALAHVPGGIQCFRLKCLKDVGGFVPLKWGGIDVVTVTVARMSGWRVRTFPHIRALHHRRPGTEGKNIFLSEFHAGIKNYFYGNHPLFQIAKCIYRMTDRPYIIGSLIMLYGYLWCFFRGAKRELPEEYLRFRKREQMLRLKSLIFSLKR